MGTVETDPQDAVPADSAVADRESGATGVGKLRIGRPPVGTPPSGMAVPDGPGDVDVAQLERLWQAARGGAVKWLLAAGLLRKLLAIARNSIANELDLRDWMSQTFIADFRTGRGEVWFDYIADTGDDAQVMGGLAWNIQRTLAADSLGEAHPELRAGEFLFVGGDTAYHVADETTLRRRFVTPWNAAHERGDARPRRPIFAIPGNHDYYDHLVGFNRLFRRPYPDGATSVLGLTGFYSAQEASYLRIRLPHDWELWGVDLQSHGLDYRQRLYFRSGERPTRLILCTPTPPVSFDRVLVARDPRDKERQAYLQLLDPSPEPDPTTPTPGFDPAFTPDSGGQPPVPGTCRLHLSGDDHHYARYDGRSSRGPVTPTSVATVVSGGGGAFTHPTEHSCGPLACAVKYPDRQTSRDRTAAALVNPVTVIEAGALHVVGAGLVLLWSQLWPASGSSLIGPAIWTACVAASLGLCAGSLLLARYVTRWRIRRGKQARARGVPLAHPRIEQLSGLSVFLAPLGILAAIAVPFLAHLLFEDMNPLSGTSLWLLSTTIFVVALVLFASLRGTENLVGALPRLGFALLGLAHAAMQLVLPYLMVRRGWLFAALAIAVILIAFPLPAKALYRRALAWPVTALWLAQGLGVGAALWWLPGGRVDPGWSAVALALVVGGFVVPMQFGFYLLTCSAWNGHNNEAGITARVTRSKQWIRFHVTKDALTGYVIGIEDPTAHPPRPRLIDRFVIAPAPRADEPAT